MNSPPLIASQGFFCSKSPKDRSLGLELDGEVNVPNTSSKANPPENFGPVKILPVWASLVNDILHNESRN